MRKQIKLLASAVALGSALIAGSWGANAHTIAVGTVNAGAPGAVDLYMGTYDHGSLFSEGAILINGSSYNFGGAFGGGLAAGLGVGLVEGSNLFYADAAGAPGSATAGAFNDPTNNTGNTLFKWQVANLVGLTAGWHTYSITGMVAADWNDWNSLTANWTGRIFIPGSSTGTVPEPGIIGLFGLGLLGLGIARRRRSAK